jgi:hypothetical protein
LKDAFYFSHDSNARHDPKISAMRGVYGTEGYGWYWILVEMMREQESYKLEMQSKYAFNAFALQMQTDSKAAEQFIYDCIHEFGLFRSDDHSFWSESLLRRMQVREEKSKKARQSALKRWASQDDDANALPTQSERNASKGKERKVNRKESKDKNSPKKQYADHVHMTENEHNKLVKEHGEILTRRFIEKLNHYKASSGKKYKSDYHAMHTWVIEEVKKKQPIESKPIDEEYVDPALLRIEVKQ